MSQPFKLNAAERLLSEKTNQEKITHYTRMLNKVKSRLRKLSHEEQPMTTKRYIAWALRLEKRLEILRSRHQH